MNYIVSAAHDWRMGIEHCVCLRCRLTVSNGHLPKSLCNPQLQRKESGFKDQSKELAKQANDILYELLAAEFRNVEEKTGNGYIFQSLVDSPNPVEKDHLDQSLAKVFADQEVAVANLIEKCGENLKSVLKIAEILSPSFKESTRLLASSRAMKLALSLIACGAARIERSSCGSLEEFCFDGIRYPLNGDWTALFDVIGWDKAIAAAEKAEGGAA